MTLNIDLSLPELLYEVAGNSHLTPFEYVSKESPACCICALSPAHRTQKSRC